MKNIKAALPDVLLIAGAGAVSYGAWMIYPAAGFIVYGLMSIAAGIKLARVD
jgi:hypothetical protein